MDAPLSARCYSHDKIENGQPIRYSLRLYTNALMTENIALYRRLGYVETIREPYLGSTLVHMEKRLNE